MSKLILVSGEEDFLVERCVEDISVSELSLPVIRVSQDEYNRYENYGESNLYIVTDCKDVPAIKNSDDVVCAVASPSLKKWSSPFANQVFHFPRLKSYEDNNEVLTWILKEGELLNIDLTSVASALFLTCGNRLRKISSEIRKLKDLVGTTVPTVSDLKSIASRSSELSPKEILDAINRGDEKTAFWYYDLLQEKADETGWIISFIQRQFSNLRIIHKCKKDGTPEVEKIIGVHPYVFMKNILPLASVWKQETVSETIRKLVRLDYLNKTGLYDVKPELESLIYELSQESKNVHNHRS